MNNNIAAHIHLIVTLLESAADESLAANEALNKWPDIEAETDDLIKTCWHDLSHFANDEDIRCKDESYDRLQKELLNERARQLRMKYLKPFIVM